MATLFPYVSNLVRTIFYTSGATYTKKADVGAILVYVIGGGGGGCTYNSSTASDGGAGGTTSFGALCSATGGGGGMYNQSGRAVTATGGIGSGGDLNLRGQAGGAASYSLSWNMSSTSYGGLGLFGGANNMGMGGDASIGNDTNRAGGTGAAGGCAIKFIQEANIPATVTVTIGAAASGAKAGGVLIYEFIKVVK